MATTDDNPALTLRIDDNGELIESVDHRNGRVFRRGSPEVRPYADSPLTRTNLVRVESYTVLVYDELDEGGKAVRRYIGPIVGGRKWC